MTRTVPVTIRPRSSAVSRQRLVIEFPALWSPDSPRLYTVTAELADDDQVIDDAAAAFGVRRLQLDPRRGLRINGEPVKLRGACVHHDSGILGAAFLVYGVYLLLFFHGGHYVIFYYVFILPILMIVRFFRDRAAAQRRQGAPFQGQPGPGFGQPGQPPFGQPPTQYGQPPYGQTSFGPNDQPPGPGQP